MAFKFIAFTALVAAANAGLLVPTYHSTPLAHATAPVAKAIEYDHHPHYAFHYDVQDSHTGDYKNHYETRDGDVVKGSYSLLEADGTRRIVDYTADTHGFNAVVRKDPAFAKVVAPVAPVVAKVAAPVTSEYHSGYSAPAYW